MRRRGLRQRGRSYTISAALRRVPPRSSRQSQDARGTNMPAGAVSGGLQADQAASTPFALAVCVAIASISAGLRQLYGSSLSSFRRARTAPIWSGLVPDSMIDDTNAANSGGAQPLS